MGHLISVVKSMGPGHEWMNPGSILQLRVILRRWQCRATCCNTKVLIFILQDVRAYVREQFQEQNKVLGEWRSNHSTNVLEN